MPLDKVQAIVLKAINVGEADKIITLFTDKLGKIQAIVHGARKSKSKFMASTQVFSYCEYIIYKGKSLYTINQGEIKESFQGMLSNLYSLTYCSYLMELVDVLIPNEEKNIELFYMLLKTMYLITDERIDSELLIRTFELKAMSISGYMPNLNRCSICSEESSSTFRFSSKLGGILCEKCLGNDVYSIKVDFSTINTMKYIVKSEITKINMIRISQSVKNNMKIVLKNYIKYHLEREFKSLQFLDDIKNIDNI
jgi:DNA repair protein RecO (recombination protein O)